MSEKIAILHHHHYWTEYLDFLLEDKENFALVSSELAPTVTFRGKALEPFNPDKYKTVLSAGRIWDQTKKNNLIVRFLHSPGFGCVPTIEAYAALQHYHQRCDYRFLVLDAHYRALMVMEGLSEALDFYRYQMLQDSKVSTIKADPMLYPFITTPKQSKQKPGTGLVALNWNCVFEDPKTLLKLIETLAKELELSIVLHPLTVHHPEFIQAIADHPQIKKVYFDLPRKEMISLYDAHEFIIFDGSGTGYEAMMRGCKPLLVTDLHYQKESETFHGALTGGYLPFQSYLELSQYKSFDNDAFLREHFPFLFQYSQQEAIAIAKSEIYQIDFN